MGTIEIESYAEKPICTFADWENLAMPPERKVKQWKKGRSAYELGWSWMESGEPAVPGVLIQLLDSHQATRGSIIRSGITEHETVLPFGNGGPRCHDLVLKAERDGQPVTICIEAKADESFDGTVADKLKEARRRPRTRFPERLDWLTRSLLGLSAFEGQSDTLSSAISGLGYQLFSAVGGTLLEASLQGATKAIWVVHEFRTDLTEDAKMEANGRDMDDFLRLLLTRNGFSDGSFRLGRDKLTGPISILERTVEGAPRLPCHIPLFIGKIRTDRTTG